MTVDDRPSLKTVRAYNLRAALDDYGGTIADVAAAAGVHRRTFERWMDPSHPSAPTLVKCWVVEVLLGKPRDWLSAIHEEVEYE